jgi:hypothetical protein
MLAVVEAASRKLPRRDDEGMLSRRLSTRPLPVAPTPMGYCGRNRRFVLRISFHIEQSLEPHRISHGRATLMPVHFPSESGASAETPHGRSNGRTSDSVRLGFLFSATRNPGVDQNFTDLTAVVQLRLRVAIGLQTLTVKSRLLTGENSVRFRGNPPFPHSW